MKSPVRLFRWLLNSLPIYTGRHVASEWVDGFIKGAKSMGITRDSRGRFRRMAR